MRCDCEGAKPALSEAKAKRVRMPGFGGARSYQVEAECVKCGVTFAMMRYLDDREDAERWAERLNAAVRSEVA